MTSLPLDETHDPARRSWVASANETATDFPIQNLPFGIFRPNHGGPPRGGVAIGDQVLDVTAVAMLLGEAASLAELLDAPTLRPLMERNPAAWTMLRRAIFRLLAADFGDAERARPHLHAMSSVTMMLPARPGGFVDFFASIQHATNAGSIFRADAPLLPNYKYVPIAYNGRVSSIGVSGSAVRRPSGQSRPDPHAAPIFGPSRRLDFESELGIFLGGSSSLGTPVPLAEAWNHIFGFCLLNDWSARDIQAWEYQPLGPFLGKSFATTISPWIVTADALRPYRIAMAARSESDPPPMPHLNDPNDQQHGALDIVIETRLSTARMEKDRCAPLRIGRASTRLLYWSPAQMLAHQTSNGCSIEPGDLFGSGTVSGDGEDALGSLLEITRAGTKPFRLADGESRTFLEDGDTVTLSARCEAASRASIGFGTCSGRVLPALWSSHSASGAPFVTRAGD